jgi:hypothetical protein
MIPVIKKNMTIEKNLKKTKKMAQFVNIISSTSGVASTRRKAYEHDSMARQRGVQHQ